MTAIVLALSMIGGPSAPAAAQATAAEDLARVRSDVDLAAGFESRGAPLELYPRLQDELLFAFGAEDLLPSAARLAGVESGAGVTGLVVVARGTGRLAITPARASASLDEPLEAATPSRRLSDSSFALGDLSLLGDPTNAPATPLEPSPGNAMSSRRCAWVIGRPGWLRGPGRRLGRVPGEPPRQSQRARSGAAGCRGSDGRAPVRGRDAATPPVGGRAR